MSDLLSVRRTVRFRVEENAQIVREAKLYGKRISSYMRIKLLGKTDGLPLARLPSVDTDLLSAALCKIGDLKQSVDRASSTLSHIANHLDTGSRDLFGLDGCVRELMRQSQAFDAVRAGIIDQHPKLFSTDSQQKGE